MKLPDPSSKPTLTVREAAEIVGIGAQTYYEGAARGNLPAVRISPRRIVVPTAKLWNLLGMEFPIRGGDDGR
jgi:excisionase family DNA binding protein